MVRLLVSAFTCALTLAPAPPHLTLAQRHYSARLVQLRDLIAAEEVKFKQVVLYYPRLTPTHSSQAHRR